MEGWGLPFSVTTDHEIAPSFMGISRSLGTRALYGKSIFESRPLF